MFGLGLDSLATPAVLPRHIIHGGVVARKMSAGVG